MKHTMMTKSQTFRSVTALPNEAGLPRLRITTGDLDRDRDRVIASGGDVAAFLKNPVLFWGHQHHEVPIGTVVRLDESGSDWDMSWRWLENDPFADRVKNAWEQGVVRAASIGFIPIQSTPNGFGGRDHTRWELTEVSLVGIPANRNAVKTLKALGLCEQDDPTLEYVPPSLAITRAARPRPVDDLYLEIEETFDVDPVVVKAGVEAAVMTLIEHQVAVAVKKTIDYARGKVS